MAPLEPFQQATSLAGQTPLSTLDATLKSSTICSAIAGNAEATAIMKENYSSSMKSYIDSNFNDGLNLLNYKAKIKCYLYKDGNQCSNITGGWNNKWYNTVADVANKFSISGSYIDYSYTAVGTKNQYQCGGVGTVNKIPISGFNTLSIQLLSSPSTTGWTEKEGYYMQVGLGTACSSNDYGNFVASVEVNISQNISSKTTYTRSISSLSSSYYAKVGLSTGNNPASGMNHRCYQIALY